MVNVFVRSLALYIVVVIVMRIMGKRQIGQLQPFELVIAIMIAELAAIPMQDVGIPLINGLVPMLALLFAQLIISYASLKSERIRKLVCGSPSIVIENGQINQSELKRLRYNLNDLLEQLRSKDIPSVSDVEFAILETGGQLNVIPKSQKRPVTPEDLQIKTEYEAIPITLIMDGHIQHANLTKVGLGLPWLHKQLEKQKLTSDDVFFAYLDTLGEFYAQPKEGVQP